MPADARTRGAGGLMRNDSRGRTISRNRYLLLLLAAILVAAIILLSSQRARQPQDAEAGVLGLQRSAAPEPVLISYSYFEKDPVQLLNMQFFLAVGMGHSVGFQRPNNSHIVIVISGAICTPCAALMDDLTDDPAAAQAVDHVSQAWSGVGLTMLQRTVNEGMDFAAHNVTIELLRRQRRYRRYRYFIFLNSSVRGPFFPAFMPQGWQWPMAFTHRMGGDIKAVASSIVCLPRADAGGYGPKMESWALALDRDALDVAIDAGVYGLRTDKFADTGIIVMGEYGLSKAILGAGFNIATLMAKYAVGVDWRQPQHWHCNNNVHPSRHGTYNEISMHPFETLFLKASWHVGEPHLSKYTTWFMEQADGSANTDGAMDERTYRYAISERAAHPDDVAKCFHVRP